MISNFRNKKIISEPTTFQPKVVGRTFVTWVATDFLETESFGKRCAYYVCNELWHKVFDEPDFGSRN